ncbi:hypothetical protein AND_007737 [Anopheles darlingi]|uniref:Uncharacterized protein n=1 Tax=Anopheles darlingi TaxID=43151 RepID=W5JCN5_ANODA|nr:hypothetical protein AND_007737 [Anopheles darlingi]
MLARHNECTGTGTSDRRTRPPPPPPASACTSTPPSSIIQQQVITTTTATAATSATTDTAALTDLTDLAGEPACNDDSKDNDVSDEASEGAGCCSYVDTPKPCHSAVLSGSGGSIRASASTSSSTASSTTLVAPRRICTLKVKIFLIKHLSKLVACNKKMFLPVKSST